MSEDFLWKPDRVSRASTARIAVVLACAALGIVAGSLYPISLVMTAIERSGLPRVAPAGNTSATAQKASQPALAQPVEPPRPTTGEAKENSMEARGRVVILNPGSAESRIAPDESTAKPPPERRTGANETTTTRKSAQPVNRNVLVVVKRRGPPYDTKILRGRIRDGQLIVNARDRRGIALR